MRSPRRRLKHRTIRRKQRQLKLQKRVDERKVMLADDTRVRKSHAKWAAVKSRGMGLAGAARGMAQAAKIAKERKVGPGREAWGRGCVGG